MSCYGSCLLRLHHSFHSPRVEVAVEASKSQHVFSDSQLRARLSSGRSFSLILQSAFTGQRRIFRCNFANIAVSQRMLETKQARCVPVCLFGGLFGNKQSKEASKVPDLKFHESTAIPFPSSLLADTFLAGKELKCCYKASVDGFGATEFHTCCDFKGPCVVVGCTTSGFRFGAFNPEGYRSTDDYYDTFDAFLFYWNNNDNKSDVKVLPKVGGSGAALFDYARGGPQFGADGLLIGPPLAPVMGGFSGPDTNSGIGDLHEARSRLGLSYAKRDDGKDSLFGEDRTVTLVELEIFCCPAIARLY
ncbi:unnamed protein product [Sphagnum jensenii]|uniref:TLDc domain-containing protein n=1 Tax=Sphagnum jensenii TaxID=128206 RepID=A0ABP0XJW8_9BRYO